MLIVCASHLTYSLSRHESLTHCSLTTGHIHPPPCVRSPSQSHSRMDDTLLSKSHSLVSIFLKAILTLYSLMVVLTLTSLDCRHPTPPTRDGFLGPSLFWPANHTNVCQALSLGSIYKNGSCHANWILRVVLCGLGHVGLFHTPTFNSRYWLMMC